PVAPSMLTQLKMMRLVRSNPTGTQPSSAIFLRMSLSVGLVKARKPAPATARISRSRHPTPNPAPAFGVGTSRVTPDCGLGACPGTQIGHPQCGHVGALSETCFLHSGQLMRAMESPEAGTMPRIVPLALAGVQRKRLRDTWAVPRSHHVP